jgi:hypothetical protein
MQKFKTLIFKRVSDGGYHTQFFDVRRVLIAVLNLKLALSGCLYLA